jgi:hypothetical protein
VRWVGVGKERERFEESVSISLGVPCTIYYFKSCLVGSLLVMGPPFLVVNGGSQYFFCVLRFKTGENY